MININCLTFKIFTKFIVQWLEQIAHNSFDAGSNPAKLSYDMCKYK